MRTRIISTFDPLSVWIGVISSLLFLPLRSGFICPPLGLSNAHFLIGLLVVIAIFAGISVTILHRQFPGKTSRTIGTRYLHGAKAGWHSALTSGALLSFFATVDALAATNASTEVILKLRMWQTFLICLAAILPCVFAGFFGGIIGVRLIRFPIQKIPSSPNNLQPSYWKWLSHGLTLLSCLGLCSPLVFLYRAPKVDPLPRITPAEPPEAKPSPPAFHYEVPTEWASVSADQMEVAFTKTLKNVTQEAVLGLSSDGKQFVFCQQLEGHPCVTHFDLDSFKSMGSLKVPDLPRKTLAWSPDNKRLACVCTTGEVARVCILDLDSLQTILLPRPQNGDIPKGEVLWLKDFELAFFPEDEASMILDLASLDLKPLDQSAFFSQADEATQKRWLEGPLNPLPATNNWKFTIGVGMTAHSTTPRRDPSAQPSVQGAYYLAFKHPKLPANHLLINLPVEDGMRVLCTPDGSKIIRVKNGKAEVSYMKTRTAPSTLFEVNMPMTEKSLSDDLASRVAQDKDLCAFVSAPLINPLNNATIGPDPSQVKALLQLVEWKDQKAVFHLVHAVDEIHAKDVISTFHFWNEGKLSLWMRNSTASWWNLASPDLRFSTTDHPIEKLPPLQTPISLSLEPEGTAFRVSKIKEPRWNSALTETKVRSFLLEHHQKASAGDIDGMLVDYSKNVDFLDKGQIQKEQIATDERTHRQKWPLGHETIQGKISLDHQKGIWQADYTLEFYNENSQGAWQRGLADVTMQLVSAAGRLEIINQKARVYEVNHSADPLLRTTAPKTHHLPDIKIRLPDPVWVDSTEQPFGTEILAIHEAIRLKNARALIHRTYRVLVGPQTPSNVAAQFPNGLISMMTAEIEGTVRQTGPQSVDVYCGVQGWVQDTDARIGEWNPLCERDASSIVGTNLSFRFEGEDLIASKNGHRLKLVKKRP